MSRVLKDELQDLRKKIMTCFRETLPSKQFNALLSLSTIWLGVLVDRETKTEDQEERRCIEDEFEEGKRAVEKGIETLYGQARRSSEESLASTSRALPRMRRTYAADRTLLHLSGLR
jgi:hypothetical protein